MNGEDELGEEVVAEHVGAEQVVRCQRRLWPLHELEELLASGVRRDRPGEPGNHHERGEHEGGDDTHRLAAEAAERLSPRPAARDRKLQLGFSLFGMIGHRFEPCVDFLPCRG